MAGKWDSFTKRLIGLRPEQYTNWLMPNATLVGEMNIELKPQHFFADALLKVLLNEQPALLHIELQTYTDTTMGKRMLEYNVLAEHQYELPTCSFVVYLRKLKVGRAPYVRRFIDGGLTHKFHFRTVKLWEVTAQEILDLGCDGLLPLLPFTKGGKRPEIIQVMINRLAKDSEKELLALAEMFGGLAFTKESEKVWFKRRFAMFQDIMKDSWVYQELRQEMLEEGLAQGLEEGLAQGLEQGRAQGLEQGFARSLEETRQAIVQLVKERFPGLEMLAAQRVAPLADLRALHMLLVEVASTRETEVARRLLACADERA